MHLILGACCEKLPPGIFYPAPLEALRINHLNSKPLKVLLPSLSVFACACVWVGWCLCACACAYDGKEHWALNACVKLQKLLGLISQPFRGLVM